MGIGDSALHLGATRLTDRAALRFRSNGELPNTSLGWVYALSETGPLLKNEWVEIVDPALPRPRTHGGTGAGALALVKPLPPKAMAGRPGFTRAKRPRLESPPADRSAAVQDHALAPRRLPRATSPIRNSIEPIPSTQRKPWLGDPRHQL